MKCGAGSDVRDSTQPPRGKRTILHESQRLQVVELLVSTPLLLAGNSIAITVHLRAGTGPEEELRFIAGCHLGATCPTIASILHR